MSNKIATIEEIFESENLNVNEIVVSGIPERHIEAVKAIAKLFVATDFHNPKFQPDFTNYEQDKYSAVARMGSPSGVGFAYAYCDRWASVSDVGSRLISESSETAELLFENYKDLFEAFMVYQRDIK